MVAKKSIDKALLSGRSRRLARATGVPAPMLYQVCRWPIWAVGNIWQTTEVIGLHNIPHGDGPPRTVKYHPGRYSRNSRHAVDIPAGAWVANHPHGFDVISVGEFRQPIALAGKPVFNAVPPASILFDWMGLVPVERSKDRRVPWPLNTWYRACSYNKDEFLDVAAAAMRRGIPLMSYPQGERKGKKFHDGPLIAACRAGTYILPMGISGTGEDGEEELRSPRRPHRRLAVVSVGEPIYVPEYPGDVPPEVLDSLRKQTMDAIAEQVRLADQHRHAWRTKLDF